MATCKYPLLTWYADYLLTNNFTQLQPHTLHGYWSRFMHPTVFKSPTMQDILSHPYADSLLCMQCNKVYLLDTASNETKHSMTPTCVAWCEHCVIREVDNPYIEPRLAHFERLVADLATLHDESWHLRVACGFVVGEIARLTYG